MPAVFESQYVTVCRSVVGFFFSPLSFFSPQDAEGIETSRLPKPTSASKLTHVRSVSGVFACLFQAQCRHGGCPRILWRDWDTPIASTGNGTRGYVTMVEVAI